LSKIYIIDDDFAVEPVADYIRAKGHNVIRFKSAEDALKHLDEIASSDLVIIDLMMERPPDISEVTAAGGLRTGIALIRELRKQNSSLSVMVFSATQEHMVIDQLSNEANTVFISKLSIPSLETIEQNIDRLLGSTPSKDLPQSFIVHGHDDKEKLAIKNFLQNNLSLPEPIILHEQASKGKTILEKLEAFGAQASVIFVLLTPDDKFSDGKEINSEKRRCRQNVIFEMGYFLGLLGRKSGRVILLHKGLLDLPSDISGLVYIDISKGVEAAGENIRRELKDVC